MVEIFDFDTQEREKEGSILHCLLTNSRGALLVIIINYHSVL